MNVFKSTEARPMPGRSAGPVAWLRSNLFSSLGNSLMSLALLAVCLWALVSSLDWAVLQAVFGSNLQACNDARGAGACWGVISEKGRLIVMGRYPEIEHWRPVIATALMLGVVVISCMPRFWNKALPLIWAVMLAVYFVLMKGGFFGLTSVDTDQWGGLPLTVMLTVISMTLAFPLALLLRMERFAPLRLVGLLLGLAAVALLAAPGAALPDPAMAAFLPVALIGPLFYAVEGIYVARRGMGGMDAIQAMFGASVVALVLCVPVTLALGQWFNPFGGAGFGRPEAALAASSVVHALMYAGYVWLASRAGAVFAAQCSYIVTGAGVLWAMALLGERFSPFVWVALVLLLCGVALVSPRDKARTAPS